MCDDPMHSVQLSSGKNNVVSKWWNTAMGGYVCYVISLLFFKCAVNALKRCYYSFDTPQTYLTRA